jgi:hypothetical protein
MSRFSLLVLCLSSFAFRGTLIAQDDPAHLDAFKEFANYWKKAKDEALQVAAVETLKENECRPAADELLKLLKHPTPAVQHAAFDVLSSYQKPATFQVWIDELPKAKDSEQIATIVKVLGGAKVKAAVPAIEQVGADPKASATVKFEVARALHLIGVGGDKGVLGILVADKEPAVRLAALDAIGALKLKQHGDAVVALLGDNEWQVQSAAIAAVGQLRIQAAIQPLIDLQREVGRLQIECSESLFKITGTDLGVDPTRWQDWWRTTQEIASWRIPTDEELAKKAESRKKYDALYGKQAPDTPAFANIPINSTNVLFIIDVSGSMDDLVVEVEKFQGYRDRKRFTIVQTELLNTIEALTANTNFDIVAFATDIHPWKRRLVPANVVNKDAARSWVRNLKPIGGNEAQDLAMAGLSGAANLSAGKTNTLKALMHAFGIDPEKPVKQAITGFDRAAVKGMLDTVYFLSDGRPSIGKLIEAQEILHEVRRYNEIYKMVFHAIAIGDFQKEFLQQLAEENGGVFVDMGR